MARKKDKKTTALEQKEKTVRAYKRLFDSDDGNLVLKDLLKTCHFDGCTFVSGDPYESAFNEGARSVVMRLIRTLNMDLETIIKLNREQQLEQETFYGR